MKRLSLFGLVLVAVLGLSAFMASTASAANAPYWSIGGTRLGAGKTHNITAKSFENKVFRLASTGSTSTCTALKLKEGVLLGSAEGEPGLNNEVLVFTGCSAVDGTSTACEVKSGGQPEGTIVTNSLKSELVEDETGKKLLLLLQPASGSTFVTLEFTGGTGCTPATAAVNGSYVLRVLTDNSAREDPELGGAAKQGTSWLLETQTQPESVTKYKAGVGTVTVTKAFQFAGKPATEEGTALVLLANAKGETEEILWSPLP